MVVALTPRGGAGPGETTSAEKAAG